MTRGPSRAAVGAMFPEKGKHLARVWRFRPFEYQWLRTLGGKHGNLSNTTEEMPDAGLAKADLKSPFHGVVSKDTAKIVENAVGPQPRMGVNSGPCSPR
ncbi:MAG TPA: hypothetical protein PLS03_03660 [Terrimicrobiaceae bacterium]|nr:hypothetical protein [Terrimicrobiaceae bacterium]